MGGIDQPVANNSNRVATDIRVFKSDLVENAVAEVLGFDPDVSISAVGDTDIIRISATSEPRSNAPHGQSGGRAPPTSVVRALAAHDVSLVALFPVHLEQRHVLSPACSVGPRVV